MSQQHKDDDYDGTKGLEMANIIILEGNISAGKTYLCNKLGELLNYKVFLEPTTTNPFLEQFYKEPSKYALEMQLWLLNQRYHTYKAALTYCSNNIGNNNNTSNNNIDIDNIDIDNIEIDNIDKQEQSNQKASAGVILDRSVFSDWVFAENCRREGLISSEGFSKYSDKRKQLISTIEIPHTTIYLSVEPSECQRRIQSLRKRECEQSIPLSYLEGLDSCYQVFLDEMKQRGSKVLVVDWNRFGDASDLIKQLGISSDNGKLKYKSIKNINGDGDDDDFQDRNKSELDFLKLENHRSTISITNNQQ
ncbi:deoxyguanosine kinase [Cavenderia fasciculata]|uniref:Deoxyguanosine kinase n=1 Tax=Cavenderia fasciculata TaxID=261658 RepID=F4Q1T7_CACFS|nr:deoxyguanosine kinase [Cavenderia fasciculata]EGG17957.1 deoxyguanosine kinase [Cavenderia fasciculata]|eukprot:XP_004356849.1 deoxyguanosine kinase [Cavenderia fasciculata]